MRWSRVGWPAVGYVSFEDLDGYAEHLARLVSDAPPAVAALASVTWNEARIAEWHIDSTDGVRGAEQDAVGIDEVPTHSVQMVVIVRTDEVLDTPDGLWRRWNHARVTLDLRHAVVEPIDTEPLAVVAGDVHVARGEIAHVDSDVWELRLLLTPTGELAIHFRDVSVTIRAVPESAWADLGSRVPDGWVEWASPVVRAAAHGDVGGLSLEFDGFGSEPAGVDDVDPRWGFAPLHAAAWFDRTNTTLALLERGADPGVRDAEGRTALEIARDREARGVEAILREQNA